MGFISEQLCGCLMLRKVGEEEEGGVSSAHSPVSVTWAMF